MSCGLCAEFCPFDAIKMDHDYELAVYDRYPQLVYNKAELTVPLEYYAALWPTQFAEEQAARGPKRPSAPRPRPRPRPTPRRRPLLRPRRQPPRARRGKAAAPPADIEAMKKQAQERAAAAKARAAGGAAPASSQGAVSGDADVAAQPAVSEAGLTAPAAAAADALSETGDVAADAPAAAADRQRGAAGRRRGQEGAHGGIEAQGAGSCGQAQAGRLISPCSTQRNGDSAADAGRRVLF